MARFVGGELQAEFTQRIRGIDPGRCLVVPVDVGKSMAMSLVADHFGEIVTAPFEFDPTETGVAKLIEAVVLAERERSAIVIRIGERPPATTTGRSWRASEELVSRWWSST